MESTSTFAQNDNLCFVCLDQQGKYTIKSHNELLCLDCTLHFIREREPCPICRFEPFDKHTNYNIHQRYTDMLNLAQDIIYQFYCQIYPVLYTDDRIHFFVKDPENPFKKPLFTLNIDNIYNYDKRTDLIIQIFNIFVIYADIHIDSKQTKYDKSTKGYYGGSVFQIYGSYKRKLEWEDSTRSVKDQMYKLYEQIKDDITLQNTIKYKILKMNYLFNYLERNDRPYPIRIPLQELNKLTDEQTFRQLQINDILYKNAQYYGLYMNFE